MTPGSVINNVPVHTLLIPGPLIMNRIRINILRPLLLVAAFVSLLPAMAWDTAVYAPHSVLASGRWVRVSVTDDGPVRIPAATLAQWGFSDPAAVKVFGYGGRRQSDILQQSTYIDDLPQLQTAASASGLIFYAQGSVSVTVKSDGSRIGTPNPFSDKSYYYLTDDSRFEPRAFGQAQPGAPGEPTDTYTGLVRHEQDQVTLSESGHALYGEEFRYTPSRLFNLDLPGRVDGTPVRIVCSFVANTGAGGTLTLSHNGATITETKVGSTGNHQSGTAVTVNTSYDGLSGVRLPLTVAFAPTGTVSAAHLDAINVTYTGRLELGTKPLQFTADDNKQRTYTVSSTASDAVAYVVTDPHNIKTVATADGGKLSWSASGLHTYSVWSDSRTTLPAPTFEGTVANTDLHNDDEPVPQMVIIARQAWLDSAEELADIHRTDSLHPLDVKVVGLQAICDEFGSGVPDVGAVRRYLKMLYDRGLKRGTPLRSVLLMGRATYDNRGITPQFKALGEQALPTWCTDESLRDMDSYTTDDWFAFLEDNSGRQPASDVYSIAVGRMPVGTPRQAAAAVAKLKTWLADNALTGWRNRVLLVADDGNTGVHMTQTEKMQANMLASGAGDRMFYHKAYIDAFPLVGGTCVGARERMHRLLDEGIMLWTYVGHAGRNFITGDNMLSYTDINNLRMKHYPVFVGATCSFSRWDGTDPSGCELMFANDKGGIIAAISAVREVLISENGHFVDALGKDMFDLDDNGYTLTLGEAYRRAKNRLASPYGRSNSNKLWYVLMGDPELRPWPDTSVTTETIAGSPSDGDEPPVVMARQTLTVDGVITGPDGKPDSSFNGTLTAALHDAEYSTTSSGRKTTNDGNGEPVTFEEQGEKLFAGNAQVVDGRFSLRVAMPSEIADNYRPAALTFNAIANDGRHAVGCDRRFYVYGFDENAPADDRAPVIQYIYLNHESFTPGAPVNTDPLLLARLTDDTGINLSTAGIGHGMTLRLDSAKVYTDVPQYYSPLADGTPGGTLAYPLSDLEPGQHSLELRVWDTSGNSSASTIHFEVRPGLKPTLFDVYTDPGPATDHASFYVRHNRPDAEMTVSVDIYDLMGRHIWSGSVSDRSDMFVSAPVIWNLVDGSGRRVPRGIYNCRVTVAHGPERSQAVALRVAVAGR